MNHRARARVLLLIILIGSSWLRLHRLDWHEASWPHPDERAIISQTYDLMVEDSWAPRHHTWGHLSYYATIVTYKLYTGLRMLVDGSTADPEGRASAIDGPLPGFHELVAQSWHLPFGVAVVLAFAFAGAALRRLPGRWRLAVLGIAVLAVLACLPWSIRTVLTPMKPNYTEVALLGRFLSALYSSLSVLVVFRLGQRLYGRAVGLLAAAMLGVSVLAVQLAHFYASDTLQTLCVLLSFSAAAIVVEPRAARRDGAAAVGRLGRALEHGFPTAARLLWLDSPAFLLMHLVLGVAIGAAMASKFSSAPLLALPFVVWLLLLLRPSEQPRVLRHGALLLACFITLGAWYALQPWAWRGDFTPYREAAGMRESGRKWLHIMFSREFARQIYEQRRMTQGKAGGPWVQQFAHTTPFLTLFTQMARYSLGWPLGLLCIGGLIFVLLRNLVQPRAPDLLLLSWAGVNLAIIGIFKSTFPRYTLATLPFLCIFAALLCLQPAKADGGPLARGWRRAAPWAAAIAVAWGLVYSLAYVHMYADEHPWTTASRWIYANVPPTQPDGRATRIAHEEWDDTIPLALPGFDPGMYEGVRLRPYAQDGEDKLAELAAMLESADWICLPTRRLYGTIMTVPERYPLTRRYYQALFAGELGFTLRQTVTRRPHLGPLRFRDDLADESQFVYDHPKAVLFEKTRWLDAAEIARRIRDLPATQQQITRADLMRWRESPAEQRRNVARDPAGDHGLLRRDELRRLLPAEADGEAARSQIDRLPTQPGVDRVTMQRAVEGSDAGSAGAAVDRETLLSGGAETMGVPRPVAERWIRGTDALDDAQRDSALARLETARPATLVARREVERRLEEALSAPPRAPLRAQAPPQGGTEPLVQIPGPEVGSWWAVLRWLLVIELLGLAMLPLTAGVFAAWPDRGWGAGKVLGWVLATFLVWCFDQWLGLAWSMATCAIAMLVIAAFAWGARERRQRLRDRLPWRAWATAELLFLLAFAGFLAVRSQTPAIFWGEKTMDLALLNSVLRAPHLPPLEPWFSGTPLNYYYYGFVLVAFLARLAWVPAAFAFNLAVASIAALALSCGFSIAARVGGRVRWGLAGAALIGLLGNLAPPFQLAGKGVFAELAGAEGLAAAAGSWLRSPIDSLRLLLTAPGERTLWDSFWASSRAIGPGMINEYPLWSWLFADLHAHVIVMPVTLLAIALVLRWCELRSRPASRLVETRMVAALLAVVLGTLIPTNLWDFIACGGFLALAALLFHAARHAVSESAAESPRRPPALGLSATPQRRLGVVLSGAALVLFWPRLMAVHPYWLGLFPERWIGLLPLIGVVLLARLDDSLRRTANDACRGLLEVVRRVAIPVAAIGTLGVLFFAPFLAGLDTGATGVRLNGDGFLDLAAALRHFGLFATVSLLWIGVEAGRLMLKTGGPTRSQLVSGVGGVAVIEAILSSAYLFDGPLAGASALTFYLALLAPLALIVLLRRDDLRRVTAAILLLGGWGLAAIADVVVISDRMNTVFKLYLPAWILLALGSTGAIAAMARTLGNVRLHREHRWRAGFAGLAAVVAVAVLGAELVVATATSWRAVRGTVSRQFQESDIPTLDGLDFLRHGDENQQLAETVAWLNDHVRSGTVVAEAFTDRGYDRSAQISKYTGLPIVLGWPHHIKQRGHTPQELEVRAAALERLYAPQGPVDLAGVVEAYDIGYIVLGPLERETYGDALATGAASFGLTRVFVSSDGSYTIFATGNGGAAEARPAAEAS